MRQNLTLHFCRGSTFFFYRRIASRKPVFSSVGAMLERNAQEFPDRVFLYDFHSGIHTPYREFNADVNRIAYFLGGLDVQKGDRITSVLGNSPEQVYLYFAAAKAGLVSSPVHPKVTPGELREFVNLVGSKVLVVDAVLFRALKDQLTCENFPTLEHVLVSLMCEHEMSGSAPHFLYSADRCIQVHSFLDMLTGPPVLATEVLINPEDPFLILFTSGTSGKRKAATHSHRNYLLKMEDLSQTFGLERGGDYRLLSLMGLYHGNAVAWTMLFPMFLGGRMVLASKWTPWVRSQFWTNVEGQGVNAFTCNPTILQDLLLDRARTRPENFDLAALRFVICGTTTVPTAVLSEFETMISMGARRAVPVLQIYGATEILTSAFSERPNERRQASFGKPLPGVEWKIADPEGKDVSVGTAGELRIRSHTVMEHGYFGDTQATAEAFDADGFYKTGDLVRRDAEGYFYFVGRSKFTIIVGGENVYPKEVEDVLFQHPDVQDALVFGAFNPRFGESVAALVVLKREKSELRTRTNTRTNTRMDAGTEKEIMVFAGKYLTGVRVPRRIFFVDEIPRNASGKPDMNAVLDRYRYFHLEELLASFSGVQAAQVRVERGSDGAKIVARLRVSEGVPQFIGTELKNSGALISQELFDALSRGITSVADLTDEQRLAYFLRIQKLLPEPLELTWAPSGSTK